MKWIFLSHPAISHESCISTMILLMRCMNIVLMLGHYGIRTLILELLYKIGGLILELHTKFSSWELE